MAHNAVHALMEKKVNDGIDLYDDDDSIEHGVDRERGLTKIKQKPGGQKVDGVEVEDDDNTIITIEEEVYKRNYGAQREALRARVMQEVLDAALPDRHNIDTEMFISDTRNEKGGFMVSCLKLFGCLDSTLHDALTNNSIRQARRIIKKINQDKEKGRIKDDNIINALNEEGRSAICCSIILKREPFIEFFIENDADVNIPDENNGMTPLMYVLVMGLDHSILLQLLNAGAEIGVADLRAITPCMLAASKGNSRALDLFLKRGTHLEPDLQDENGWTALHHAAYGGNSKCCTLLLSQGADKMVKDAKGRKPLDIARYLDYGDCLVHLEDLKSRIAFELGEHLE